MRAAPERWRTFLSALSDYTEDRAIELVQAPPDMLPTAQGRAQALSTLVRLLDGCGKTAESIEKQANKASPNAKKP